MPSNTRTARDCLILVALGVIHLQRPQKMINFVTAPHPTHLKKLTIDLEFKKKRIRNHVPSFKTPPLHFPADVLNIWFFVPKIFKSNYLTYLSVALSFQERKLKKTSVFQNFCYSADSFCTTNPRNRGEIEKTLYY